MTHPLRTTFSLLKKYVVAFAVSTILPVLAVASVLPPGFMETEVQRPDGAATWNEAVGVAFSESGHMYVWERTGKVWIIDDHHPVTTPMLDISSEVLASRDHGMLGFALNPNFEQNGYLYLMYVVDPYHLARCDSPFNGAPVCDATYNAGTTWFPSEPNTPGFMKATIGRIVRYQAVLPPGETSYAHATTIDPASRRVLLGETTRTGSWNTGIPILFESHGVGSLVFGTDGTLMVSAGDGASYTTADVGSAPETYYLDGIATGVIAAKENVGALRAQMIDSLNGKILRIDPSTGDGVVGNPYYDGGSPRAARSRVWARGLRNPYRFTLRPDTGSHNREAGAPGTLIIGDVGWREAEDINVARVGGENFGWPLFEGMDPRNEYQVALKANPDAPNPLFNIAGCAQQFFNFQDLIKQDSLTNLLFPNPCDGGQLIPNAAFPSLHARPVIDYEHSLAITRFSGYDLVGNAVSPGIGDFAPDGTTVTGTPFMGNSSTGGTWFRGLGFPIDYTNTYFHGDYGGQWIKNLSFDSSERPTAVRGFLDDAGGVVALGSHPAKEGLYYIAWTAFVRHVTYQPGNRAPIARAAANPPAGPSPLVIAFSSAGSSDPDGDPISYLWDFGDSTTSSAANPIKTYSVPGSGTVNFDATLTVTDSLGQSGQSTVLVSVNNSAPSVTITTPLDGSTYTMTGPTTVQLTANIQDNESPLSELSCQWQTVLYHNNHEHSDPFDGNCATTATISPIGCDGESYSFGFRLRVADPFGLQAADEVRMYPACGVGGADGLPPSRPTGVSAVATGTTQVNVTWLASTDGGGGIVAGYRVYRDGVFIGTSTNVGYLDTGLISGRQYSYTVSAYDNADPVNHSQQSSPPAVVTTQVSSSWTGRNIGAVAANGSHAFGAGGAVITIVASGADIWNKADEFYFLSQPLTGDGVLTARVVSVGNTDPWAKSGVMIRESTAAGSRHAMMVLAATSGAAFQYRTTTNGSSGPSATPGAAASAPLWVRIQRAGNTFTGFYSSDGVVWTQRGSITIAMNATTQVGLASTSHNDGVLMTAVFDNITFTPAPPAADTTPPSVPSGLTATGVSSTQVNLAWNASTDVGGTVAGYRVYRDGATTPLATVTGTTYSDTGLAPSTLYTYAVAAFDNASPANVSALSASVAGQTSAPPIPVPDVVGLKQGPAESQITNAGFVVGTVTLQSSLTVPNGRVISQSPVGGAGAAPGSAINLVVSSGEPVPDLLPPSVPTGVSAVASGATQATVSWTASTDAGGSGVAGYRVSRDGLLAGTVTGLSFNDTGLVPGQSYVYTVVAFDNAVPENVSAASAPANVTLPAYSPWTGADIGAVSAAGSHSEIGGTYTINASGADIWAKADEFYFLSQPLSGDGQLTARVVSIGNTDPWAKTGVMIRETTAAGSRHAMMVLTATSGAAFQYRTSTNGSSGPSSTPGAPATAPQWVRIRRVGNTFTGFYSTDGVTWTQRGSITISMSASTRIGLATTSHNDGVLTQATVDSVSLVSGSAPDTQAPSVPTGLTVAAVSTTQVNLSWAASTDTGGGSVAGYRVYRDGQATPIATVTGTSYADAGLAPATSYSYTVAAFDTATPTNVSAQSAAVVATTFDPPPPDLEAPIVPLDVTATADTSTQVTVSWSPSIDLGGGTVAGYHVYRNGAATPVGNVTVGTTYTDTGLTASTTYSYAVSAYDTATPLNESAVSFAITVTTPPPPPPDTQAPTAPMDVVATANSASQITVSWSAATDLGGGFVAGYRVYRDGAPAPIATVTGTTFVDSGLTALSSYSYTVAAFDNAVPVNESERSTAASATTAAAIVLVGGDVGAVAAAGSHTVNGGVYTINASGADIWGTADEFYFLSQTLNGDGQITARIVSLVNTDPWAKTGVMIRESTAAGSRHAMMVITSANGAVMQYRTSTNGTSGPSGVTGTAVTMPQWVRLNRQGNTFRGYHSLDGLNWTLRLSFTLSMNSSARIGLATTSHKDGTLTQAVIDNVAVEQDSSPDTVAPTAPTGVQAVGVRASTYGAATGYASGLKTHSTHLRDLDGDGHVDLMAANAGSDSLTVFMGRADGTFGPATSYPVGTYPKAAVTGKFNADAHWDILTADQNSNTVSLLLGNGDGTFQPATSIPSCNANHDIAVADFNGDAKDDFAVACHRTPWVTNVFIGNGDGTFLPPTALVAGSEPHSVAAHDFNADGHVDLVIASRISNFVSVHRGNGNGTFQAGVSYATGAGPHSVRAADLDGDGDFDLVSANDTSASITVLRGAGDGTFSGRTDYATLKLSKHISLADLDNDGDIDVVTTNVDYPTCCTASGNKVSVFANRGDGVLLARADYTAGKAPFATAVHDFDGDGVKDIVSANWHDGNVTVLKGLLTSSIALSWNASSDFGTGVSGYRVYRNGVAAPVATTMTPAYIDTAVTAGAAYAYEVTAIDGATPVNESARSTTVNATAP